MVRDNMTAHSVPAVLLEWIRAAMAAFLAVPEICTANEAAEVAQRALSNQLCGGTLDAQYAAARARFPPPGLVC